MSQAARMKALSIQHSRAKSIYTNLLSQMENSISNEEGALRTSYRYYISDNDESYLDDVRQFAQDDNFQVQIDHDDEEYYAMTLSWGHL